MAHDSSSRSNGPSVLFHFEWAWASRQASISVSNHFVVSSILTVACGFVVFITSNYSFGQMMMMMLSLHLKASNQPSIRLVSDICIASWIDIHQIVYIYIQHFAIYAATVTAILNAEHATGISKSESETHIHFYMITSLNNFLSFSFSLSVSLPSSIVDFCSSDSAIRWLPEYFFRVLHFSYDELQRQNRIEWIRNLHFVEEHTHTHTCTNDCSVVQMKGKQRQSGKIYTRAHSRKALAIIRNTQMIWIAK